MLVPQARRSGEHLAPSCVEQKLMPAQLPAKNLSRLERTAKRTFDIGVALVGIVLTGPLMLAVAAAIKLTQGGEVLYRGKRTGLYGKPFYILKFRSMVPNAEQIGGTTTGKDDPRLTPVGKVIRRFKIDELPQFFNVLRGDMSIVGPRPEVDEYTNQYTDDERRILSMRPGITDFASLRFNDLQEVVGQEDPDEYFRQHVLPQKNALRLQYVDQWSLGTDVKILARTAAVVASKPFRRAA